MASGNKRGEEELRREQERQRQELERTRSEVRQATELEQRFDRDALSCLDMVEGKGEPVRRGGPTAEEQ